MTTCVIPTKNEADTIGPLVEYLTFFGDVIVPDASDSGTTAVNASIAGARDVIPLHFGKLGTAYLTAWKYTDPFEPLVHVDAGDSHRHSDIARIVEYTEMNRWDVVIGSRFTPGGSHDGTRYHRWLSKTAARVSNSLSPYHVEDWTSGLRGYSPKARHAILDHRFACDGHAWQIEALYACLKAGCSVREVPVGYTPSTSQRGVGRTLEAFRAWGVMVRA